DWSSSKKPSPPKSKLMEDYERLKQTGLNPYRQNTGGKRPPATKNEETPKKISKGWNRTPPAIQSNSWEFPPQKRVRFKEFFKEYKLGGLQDLEVEEMIKDCYLVYNMKKVRVLKKENGFWYFSVRKEYSDSFENITNRFNGVTIIW
ncbi:hypothetical protein BB558_007388, partial [Smittium angustum]